jgi:hypothetical protein
VCLPITFNHGVEGSSPSALTKKNGRFSHFHYFYQIVRGLLFSKLICSAARSAHPLPDSGKPAGESGICGLRWPGNPGHRTGRLRDIPRLVRASDEQNGPRVEIWGRSGVPDRAGGQERSGTPIKLKIRVLIRESGCPNLDMEFRTRRRSFFRYGNLTNTVSNRSVK